MRPHDLAGSLRPLTGDPARAGVVCDVDGTVAPIVERPEQARVAPRVAGLLEKLTRRYACVACISGRTALDARRIVGVPGIEYVGLHGAEVLGPGADHAKVAPEVASWHERVQEFAAAHATASLRSSGVRVEDKGPIVAFHWRGADDEEAAWSRLRDLADEAATAGLATHWGRKVLEVRPPVGIGKGLALGALVVARQLRAALYAGDDATDLDAFAALDALVASGTLTAAVRVGVRSDEGPREIVARADVVVDGVDGFTRVLGALFDASGGAGTDRR